MTTLKVFVDTSAFVSLKDKNDPNHHKSINLAQKLERLNAHLYTSSDVIGETLTVISRKLGKPAASAFYQDFSKSALTEIFIDLKIHERARSFFLKVKSKNISFIDCSSAVIMKEAGIKMIFALDNDFKQLGVSLFT